MKGIILAGGEGTRMKPCTNVTNKHLLPVYNKPMIMYPLHTLLEAGINEIMIISGPGHSGDFCNFLGSGRKYNAKFTYEIQDKPGGIAQALGIAESFVGTDSMVTILGDNIFEDNLEKAINDFDQGAKIFLKQVPDPERFGIAQMEGHRITGIEEKPEKPKSNFAVTGLYLFECDVFDIIKELKPSKRGELEITDVNNHYIKEKKMKYSRLKGFWSDAGTFESNFKAAHLVKNSRLKDIFN